jgi:hypothetical protein
MRIEEDLDLRQSTWRARLLAGAILAPLAAPVCALADPAPADTASIVTLQDENSSISSSSLSDRYYVNGLRAGYVSPTDDLPNFIAGLGNALGARQRFEFDLEQSIFTPANTQAKPPPSIDRPYAGLLTGTLSLIEDTDSTRTVFGLQFGVVGPGAGAEELQNAFHDVIGQGHTNGWNYYQIHNEPVAELQFTRVWRLPLVSAGGFETDVLPQVNLGLGNERVYGLAGGTFRFGQGLNSDFGVARVSPALSGGDVFQPTRPFAWYVFAGADGQLVPHDVTLNGNSFETSPHVNVEGAVGELQGGLAIMLYGVRLTYTQVLQTAEFRTQKSGFHQFGSLAASVRF